MLNCALIAMALNKVKYLLGSKCHNLKKHTHTHHLRGKSLEKVGRRSRFPKGANHSLWSFCVPPKHLHASVFPFSASQGFQKVARYLPWPFDRSKKKTIEKKREEEVRKKQRRKET